jgi:hypothetical protein
MEDDLQELVRTSVRQALQRPPDEIAAALAEFGWRDLAETDESFACTALFEEQGRLAVDTDALDLAASAALGFDGQATVIWPHRASSGPDPGADGRLVVDGVALRSVAGGQRQVLVPAGARVHLLSDPDLVETALRGMARDTRWVRVRGAASSAADVGPWADVERRCRLALASELVGVSLRIIELASEQVSTRKQFGRPIGANQAVRFRLAEAYADTAGARALVAAAWEDGSPVAADWARTVAATAHDAVAKHAIQVCGAIGLSDEHPLPGLVRRGFALDALSGSSSPGFSADLAVGRF